MEIPMQDVINKYRQELSDAVHERILRDLHINELDKLLKAEQETNSKLQLELDFYKLAGEDLSDEPDDWMEK